VRLESVARVRRARLFADRVRDEGGAAVRAVLSTAVAGADRLFRWLRRGSERLLWRLGYARVDIEESRAEPAALPPPVRVVNSTSGTTRGRATSKPAAAGRTLGPLPGKSSLSSPRVARGSAPPPMASPGWVPRVAAGSKASSSSPVPPPLQPAPDPRLATIDDGDAETQIFDMSELEDAKTTVAMRARFPTDDEETRVTPANVLSLTRYKARHGR